MPNPKDPEKLEAYREKMRAIALERGYGKWMTGKSPTPETRAKLQAAHLEIATRPGESERRSERARAAGVGGWMAGRTLPPEHRAAIGRGVSGTYEERYGPRAPEERRKRRESNRRRWDGVPRKPQRPRHNGDYHYVEWRQAVFLRDDHTCRICGVRGGRLNAHHILSWAKFEEHRYDVDNGLTLCERHHRELHRGLVSLLQVT